MDLDSWENSVQQCWQRFKFQENTDRQTDAQSPEKMASLEQSKDRLEQNTFFLTLTMEEYQAGKSRESSKILERV